MKVGNTQPLIVQILYRKRIISHNIHTISSYYYFNFINSNLYQIKKMKYSSKQGEIFISNESFHPVSNESKEISIKKKDLEKWQERIYEHQSFLFKGLSRRPEQGCFFQNEEKSSTQSLNPLKLKPFPLNFWKWPSAPHLGAAIYLVMDRPKCIDNHLILYVGETIAANKRWKGAHDCKEYLATYSESLIKAGLKPQLSIRFWIDVPSEVKARKKMEQELIQQWLPPFNKETRRRWATTFTSPSN